MIAVNRHARAHTDKILIALVFLLAVFGIVAVCVATYSTTSTSGASFLNHLFESTYAMRQALFVLISPLIIGVIMALPYDLLRNRAGLFYLISLALLVVTTVFNRAQGVKAWLDVIWGYTIQPSEFAKLTMILMLARLFSQLERPLSDGRSFFRTGLIVGIPVFVILAEGETGSMLVICFLTFIMMYFGNVRMRTLVIMIAIIVLGVLALYGFMVATGSTDYRLARISGFLNPELYSSSDAYQMRQSQMAIGSGGLTGRGMFVDGSLAQLNYVPADWTDFIYATIGETWGFVGCVSVLVVYILILLRMLYLAWFTHDRFGKLIITGVMGMLLCHVFENIAMTIGLMPITGIPLPFISYGGSNMVTNMGGVGLVLNVVRNRSLTTAVSTPQTLSNPYHFSFTYSRLRKRSKMKDELLHSRAKPGK